MGSFQLQASATKGKTDNTETSESDQVSFMHSVIGEVIMMTTPWSYKEYNRNIRIWIHFRKLITELWEIRTIFTNVASISVTVDFRFALTLVSSHGIHFIIFKEDHRLQVF